MEVTMKKITGALFLGLALSIAGNGAGLAADLPTKAPYMVPASTYNWSGAYIGINAGGGWLKDDEGNRNGGLIGGTLGYNFQPGGPWVWGLEGDLGYFSNSDLKYLGTVRGRIGYAIDRLLPYITGGLAVMSDDGSARAGWTLGAGLEYALMQNLSIKAEYLYVDPRGSELRGSILRAGLNWHF
jgi:outer membrane immunogenic protein